MWRGRIFTSHIKKLKRLNDNCRGAATIVKKCRGQFLWIRLDNQHVYASPLAFLVALFGFKRVLP